MEETKRQILLFGGTTEGRAAAERLLAAGAPCTVCVATEYGREVMEPDPLLTVRVGRMDRAAMADLIRRGAFACVIDATHPHAREVTEEILGACAETDVPYLRVRRDLTETAFPDPCPQKERLSRSALEENTLSGDAAEENTALTVFAKDADEAAEFLALTQGTVLLTTGSRELERICGIIGDPSRVFARVLPSPESLAACARAGLSGRQIAAIQGPFDFEMNCAMIRHTGASWLLTKETGAAGGYTEKLEAAEACRIRTVVIRAPRQDFQHSDESGRSSVFTEPMSLEQVLTKALTYLERDTKGNPKKNPERSQGGNPEKNPKSIYVFVECDRC
ncbi:MAG: precorrin-6A/cobalt-precorrin-6A reductase, partial [Eubacteriales bacterium]|nr:precorrin-6A/cobalt-precorrin-6A reductase [Eubacteriales bacterium]